MSLRPGGAPARLLLELWERQGEGERWTACWEDEGLPRLLALQYVSPHYTITQGVCLTLAGQLAAKTLEMGKPERRQE